MKTKQLILTFALLALSSALVMAAPVGTAFTYQGRLTDGGNPANGSYDLTFTLYDDASGNNVVAGPLTNSLVTVTNGQFTVALDFGADVFAGNARWLEIAVETNGATTFIALTPRQQLTPTPYAIYAESASGLSGTLLGSQLSSIGNTNGGNHDNFFVGPSGNSTMTGWQNTANGVTALQHNTGGYGNTADGFAALLYNTNGNFNTANGVNALQYNTSGSWNTANGGDALVFNTSGNYNTANGGNSLIHNTTGSWNTANGFQALFYNTTGWFNTANGDSALLNNTAGNNNTAAGYEALYQNTSGSLNTAIGNDALLSNTTGSQNTANGNWALRSNTNGSYNTASGSGALYNNTSGSANIALGVQAGNLITTGSSNIDIGNQGLSTDTNIIRIGDGQTQTFIAGVINGNGAGLTDLNVSAAQLTSIGNTNGGYANFFVGPSGNATMSGWGNTANGDGALVNNTGGTANLADGNGALNQNTSGDYNTASGYAALYNNTIGWFNTANGSAALGNNTEGFFNTAIGFGALYSNISGNNNTAIGYSALNNNTNGNNNVALGYQAGINLTGSESGNIVIGNPGLVGDNNIIRIGDGQSQAFIAGVITGDGSGLTALNAATVTGTLGTDQIPNLDAGKITTGTLAPTQIPNLDAAKITSGTVDDARLSANVALLNNSQTFSGAQTFSANVTATGSLRLNGLLRAGSETGAAPAYYPSNPDGSTGLVIRRITSTTTSSNSVVARTDKLTLIRDGTASGLNIVFAAGSGITTINATGITRTGTVVTRVLSTASPPLWTVVFSDSQKVVHYDISFGDIYDTSHTCHVVLDRYDDGVESDYFMVGTLTSTYNQ